PKFPWSPHPIISNYGVANRPRRYRRLPNEGRPPDSVRTEPRFWLSAIRRRRLSRRRARPSGPAIKQGSQIRSGLLVHSPQLLQRCLGPSFFVFLCQDNFGPPSSERSTRMPAPALAVGEIMLEKCNPARIAKLQVFDFASAP